MTDSESLFNKLKSMGVTLGQKPAQPADPAPAESSGNGRILGQGIEAVISGFDHPTPYGPAFLYQEQYGADYAHGRIPLCLERDMQVLAAWGGTPGICQKDCQNVVFLDTETSGLQGGTGTYAFLVGIGYRTPTGFELVQFFMRDPGQEPALLAALDEWLSRFNVVVTFNGKIFDLPLLNTRYTINGLTAPFSSFEHLDVLHIARKLWRDRLPSRALGELEKEIVQFNRTGEDIPGWLIPQLYFDYLRSGDARPLGGIFYHNARDILSLAALYGRIAEMLNDPLGDTVDYGMDLAAIARLYEEKGWIEQAAALYERCLETGDMPEPFFFKTMERFALLRRRKGEWELAAQLWQKAAEHGEISSCIEIAKYYEHRVRDNAQALTWARRALEILDDMRYYIPGRAALEKDIQRRISRLMSRLEY